MIKAVVFDVGGTLVHLGKSAGSAILWGERLLAYLDCMHVHLPVSPEELMHTIERQNTYYRDWSMKTLSELTPVEIWADWYLKDFAIPRDTMRMIANTLSTIRERYGLVRSLRSETVRTLEELKRCGYALGIISNTTSYTLIYEQLFGYGIMHYFDSVIVSSIAGFRKPHPGLFRMAANELQVTPDQCVYIGDTISRDVRGARDAAYRATMRIESGVNASIDAGYLDGNDEADFVIRSLLEIPELCSQWFLNV